MATKEEEKVVKFNDMVKVFGASKAKELEAGKEYLIHSHLAAKLIKKGEAVAAKETKAE